MLRIVSLVKIAKKMFKKPINLNDKAYTCVACNCNINLSSVHTAAIKAIKVLGTNLMLLCNSWVDKRERENFVHCSTLASFAENTEKLSIEEKPKKNTYNHGEEEVLYEKIGTAFKSTCQ